MLTTTAPLKRGGAADPHNIKRFLQPHKKHFGTALQEIQAGRKQSHWTWFLLPAPPHLDQTGNAIGSDTNRFFSLQSDQEVQAFLEFSTLGLHLRQNYIKLLEAIKVRLCEHGQTLAHLLGPPDASKAINSFRLFLRVAASPSMVHVDGHTMSG